MNSDSFTIKNYPYDVYAAVGQIIKNSQEWEEEFKKLTKLLNIPVKNIGNSSLNKLNDALKKNNLIDEKNYDNLKKVITIRNHINHDFFLTTFKKPDCDYDARVKRLETFLNAAQFVIFEATDFIDNKIDELNGPKIVRPTVFDPQTAET